DQRGLSQIERRVIRRRNREGRVYAIEHVVRETTVLSTEHKRYRSINRRVEQLGGRDFRIDETQLGRATPSRESKDTHAVGDGGVERVKVLDRVYEVHRSVGDSLESNYFVFDRPNRAHSGAPHVLH